MQNQIITHWKWKPSVSYSLHLNFDIPKMQNRSNSETFSKSYLPFKICWKLKNRILSVIFQRLIRKSTLKMRRSHTLHNHLLHTHIVTGGKEVSAYYSFREIIYKSYAIRKASLSITIVWRKKQTVMPGHVIENNTCWFYHQ